MERIPVEDLLAQRLKGVIVIIGKHGMAAQQVSGLRRDGDVIRIVTECSARFDTATKQWRIARRNPGGIRVESRVRAFGLPGSVSFFTTRGKIALVRTDNAPIVSSKLRETIDLPNFSNLV